MTFTDDLDRRDLAKIFKSINQPIWIVTSAVNGRRSGLTATWVHQASIDSGNPTVLIGLAPNHFTCETLSQAGSCVIHLMCNHHTDIVYRFARPSSRHTDKFKDIAFEEIRISNSSNKNVENDVHPLSVPWLAECHTAIECKALQQFDAGDRVYFLCQVVRLVKKSEGPFMRESDFFSQCTPEQIDTLRSDLEADVSLQRPLLAEWLKKLKKD